MADLRSAGCDLLTITQYLRPSLRHHPVERWVKPEEFVELREEALAMGFAGVMSGPLVRSSYRAGRLYAQAIEQRATALPAPGSRRSGPGVSGIRSGQLVFTASGQRSRMLWVLVRANEGRLSRWSTSTALRTCRMPGG
jgi:hypothetical protein